MSAHHSDPPKTTFVGREQELSEIATLLADPACRLITIVGTGGIGKTRLALQAAAQQQDQFADGVVFVPLAPVVSVDLIPAAIAGALHFSFFGSETPREQLIAFLRDNHQLLILDNFEHLIDGTDFVSELLLAAPQIKLLVTSRSRLTLVEEWVFSLGGLSYPTEIASDALENYSGIALFVHRARQVSIRFSLVDNKDAVLAICRHAEGIPLALELAASWLGVLSCQQVAEHMRHQLDFLTTELRNVPERHRSLRSVFEWSWGMLTPTEQAVFMRLSVFHGGFDVEAAAAVADASLKILAGLVDKSLIRYDGTTRYDMHELLRQFAAEKLDLTGQQDATAQHHLGYFIQLADHAEKHYFGRTQTEWFNRLETDMDNLRTALAYGSQTENGLHLAAALGWFFSERTYWNEGLTWLKQALQANPDAPASLCAKALQNSGGLAGHQGYQPEVRLYCEQAIAIARETHDDWNLAWGLAHLGNYTYDNIDEAVANLEEGRALFRKLGDKMGLTHLLIRLTWKKLWFQHDLAAATTLLDEAETLAKDIAEIILLGWIAYTRAGIALQSQDLRQAIVHFEKSLPYFREAQFPNGIHIVLIELAGAEFSSGYIDRAFELYQEGLHINKAQLHNQVRAHGILIGLAKIAHQRGQFERATYLLGAAYTLVAQLELAPPEGWPVYQRLLPELRRQLGDEVFDKAYEAGKAMTWKQAIEYGLQVDVQAINTNINEQSHDSQLTDRELEIVRLLADGLTSTEIAGRLVLSVGTIRWYLKEIYSKLDVHSRSEALARVKALKILS